MIYVEYIAREKSIPWQLFRHHGRQDWTAPSDVMVANLARTMKIGPQPHFMCWWKIPSITRMDEWEDHFRTAEGQAYASTSPVARAMDFYRCGLFDCLFLDEVRSGKLHVVEFFAPDEPPEITIGVFRRREADHPGAALAALITRVGFMAPDPGGIAIWSFADYLSSLDFLRDQRASNDASIISAGYYRNFGEDIP